MSRIATVEPIPVSYPEPNDFNALRHLCLVKITTDDGVVGWGESITQFPEANFATKAIIEGMAERVVGKDPLANIAIWYAIKDKKWWYGYRGGISSYAIAAIDMALWDIKGKILGASVLDLLGGAVHERLPVVASCHAHYEDIGQMVEEAQEWVAPGLHGVKVGFGKRGNARLGYEHDRDVEYIRRMREGLGPDQLIMIDCGWNVKWDVSTAIRRVQAFEEYGLHWIEEPLLEWDPEGYRNLRDKTTTLIAYGEKEWDLAGFQQVLDTGTVDVVGIDPGRAEGITGFKKATQLVEAARRQSNAHAWSSAICSAASLAISFSTPSAKLFEFKPLRNPMQHDLVTEPFEQRDGWVYPPTKPGLGIEVIEDVVEHYRSEKVLQDPKAYGAMA
jgi:L-alanine-DL-glutamate epimerase-like enolase superfamily enzyme